jgi:YD repeat-containing protein
MAVSRVHLMTVSLNIMDRPVGYSPPIGPQVEFPVRYGQRDAFQPANFTYSNFGPKWTCDWISYVTDNPSNVLADVNYYVMGGGTRMFTGFDTNTQSFAFQLYDQTQLKRTGPNRYEMLAGDGSKGIFSQSDGAIGTSRKIFLTQTIDPLGNAVTLTYDVNLRIVAITDAIGQVTTLTYGNTNDIYKITRVTDPFGRFASFDYDSLGRLTNITDVIGISSRFTYESTGDFINSLITPYGTNSFFASQNTNAGSRALETTYANGSRDRVEYITAFDGSPERPATVPTGMAVPYDEHLGGRTTFYWSRTACATAYGDYSKAKRYQWLHQSDTVAAAILESTKEALEGRVWYNYPVKTPPWEPPTPAPAAAPPKSAACSMMARPSFTPTPTTDSAT